jgi:ribokinase
MEREPIITVIGSINMDLIINVSRQPKVGETIKGELFETMPGGKGANQAIASARLGASVNMIGMVGDDEFGQVLVENLQKESINVEGVETIPNVSTGVAIITLMDNDNSIVVVAGANAHVTPDYVCKYEDMIAKSDIVLSQLEIPIETVEEVAEICHKYQVPMILNPAPVDSLSASLLSKITYLTPNQIEVEKMHESETFNWEDLKQKLVITKGNKGVEFFESGQEQRVPAYSVQPVDTTGAGDTFNGAVAYFMAKKKPLSAACQFANAAAALSVMKKGAQTGMPSNEDIKRFIQKVNI